MSLEDLRGKDCMVQAVVSLTGRTDAIDVLTVERLKQIRRYGSNPLNPDTEANNLMSLLELIGGRGQIGVMSIRSIPELRELLRKGGDIFIGFAKGPDSPPHIAHLGQRASGGFESRQQYTSDDMLVTQLMEQGQITVFVRNA